MKLGHQALQKFIFTLSMIVGTTTISAMQHTVIQTRLPAEIPHAAIETSSQIQREALAAHNHFRALHHAPRLTWSNALADYAARYAANCEFAHSHGPYGENLAAGYPSINAAITNWYNEQQFYSYQNPGFSHQAGHFTQVVWKDSRQLGCAYVTCDGKNGTPGNFLVCEYNPSGNVVSVGNTFFINNVLPA